MQRLNDVNPNIYNAYPDMEDIIGETLTPNAIPVKSKPIYRQGDNEEAVQVQQVTRQIEHNADVVLKTVKVKLDIELNIKINTI
jgi:hypothetical protein